MTTFTANEIATRSGSISRQGVAKLLKPFEPDAARVARGNQKTNAWTFSTIACCAKLLQRLEADARRQGYPNAGALFAGPLQPQAQIDLRAIAADELNKAAKLRDVLLPFLNDQSRPATERDAILAARYTEAFGLRRRNGAERPIRTDYVRKLYQRGVRRDCGLRDYGRLQLYLPDNPKRKSAPDWTATESNLADLLPVLESRIAGVSTPADPPKAVLRSVWHAAFEEYTRLVSEGLTQDRAARLVRDFLHARAPFMPRSRDALLKSWNEKLSRWLAREGIPGALVDLRCNNGREIVVPEVDIARLRHSTITKHSGRLDSAWREEYNALSASTRNLGKKDGRVPRPVVRAVNRVMLDALWARRQGKRYLNRLLGTVLRNVESISSMHAWVMDDLTCTLEVFVRNHDGSTSLCLIQLIVVMDVRSRKIVGWAASLDKGPTAELVCEAFLDAVVRAGKIPHHLFLENGWVFGRSNNVVGKRNEAAEVIVAGLAEYGCEVHHFTPGSPTSKGELEKSFDLLQRLMERHPGYTSRNQRATPLEQFRREQLQMRRKINPRDPATCRYDFQQGARALETMITNYNQTPQRGALKGTSPDQAFVVFENRENPPIILTPKLRWMLAFRYRVRVKPSGVSFTHFGQDIRVRGGSLASLERIGREYWAVLDRRNADCVTFMSLDFSEVFTEPLRPVVDYDESETDPDSGALQTEYETKAEMHRVIENEYQGLLDRFGEPRKQLLREAQQESRQTAMTGAPRATNRITLIDPNYAAASEKGVL